MKQISWLLILLLILPLVAHGFEKRLPVPLPDVYPVKLRTLTFFDLISKDLDGIRGNQAELTESKPEELTVDIGDQNLQDAKFGCFRLGNNDQKTWFVMGKDAEGYWSEFYLDQNLDYRLEKKEKVKGFQTGRDSICRLQRMQAVSLVPVPVTVSYKGLAALYEKELYFFIETGIFFQKKDLSDTVVMAITASFLDGEFKIPDNRNLKPVKFRIIDANGNGCFNDFGTDLLYMDRNDDGYFRKNERSPLPEYPVSRNKQQQRLIVPPFPAKIAVTDVIQEFDTASLEPLPLNNDSKSEIAPEPVNELLK